MHKQRSGLCLLIGGPDSSLRVFDVVSMVLACNGRSTKRFFDWEAADRTTGIPRPRA